MRSDLVSNIEAAHSLAPAERTADANGAGVDLAGSDAAVVVIHHGAWTDGTHTFQVEHADDDGSGAPDTWSAVDDADLDGTEPTVDSAADDDTVTEIGYQGIRRHLRVTVSVTGATNGALYGATIVRGARRKLPERSNV